jgi:hypothetical protein
LVVISEASESFIIVTSLSDSVVFGPPTFRLPVTTAFLGTEKIGGYEAEAFFDWLLLVWEATKPPGGPPIKKLLIKGWLPAMAGGKAPG